MSVTTKTERLEARVPVALKKVIQRAARLQGRTTTDFVIASLDKSARETVREHEVMTLNADDSLRVATLLIHPPVPQMMNAIWESKKKSKKNSCQKK